MWALDNWEWAAVFRQPIGVVHVDLETLARTQKVPYRWLAEPQSAGR